MPADRNPDRSSSIPFRETEDAGAHVLLTVLGTQQKEAVYALAGKEIPASLAPLALLDLLPAAKRPNRVVALCTADAENSTGRFLAEALQDRCAVELVRISDPTRRHKDQDLVPEFMDTVARALPRSKGLELTLDVTHGLRHLTFLTYTTVLYLVALRDIRLRGAYYGMLTSGAPSRFVDLTPLLVLPQWFHALTVFRQTGSTAPIARIVGAGSGSRPASSANCGQSLERMVYSLETIADAYLSALPLELGRNARLFCDDHTKPLRKLLKVEHKLPLASELTEVLRESLTRFCLPDRSSNGWKRKVELSESELERQARIVDELLRQHNLSAALGLMREWAVSWTILRTDRSGERQNWLEHHVRRRAENLLGALMATAEDPDLRERLSAQQRKLGEFWRDLTNLRNAYHHHGMRPQDVVDEKSVHARLDRVKRYWNEALRHIPDESPEFRSFRGGLALVSPLGTRPGVLFSAMRAALAEGNGPPTACLVICSHQTEPYIDEALSRAGYDGSVYRLCLEDPYGGLDEIDGLVGRARPILVDVDDVWVNVTGGTTLMGLAAERLAVAAAELSRKVRRFGLIDRRSSEEQDEQPYRAGAVFWITDDDARR